MKKKTHIKNAFQKQNGLINLIEHRLDVVLVRARFASTLSQARQLISHRQVYVNGIVITSSFFVLKKRDIISVSPSIKKIVKTILSKVFKPRIQLFLNITHLR